MLSASLAINLFADRPNYHSVRSNRLFEAMGAGLPVIASDFPAWRTLVQETDCGVLADPHDTSDIARALRLVLTDPVRSRTLAEKGRAAAMSHFGWDSQYPATERLYARIMGAM
jgi:glycosyltransferase involved in cell wall biosynthesis